MYKLLNKISLYALEKLDKQENLIKKLGYKYFKGLFDFSFIKIYGKNTNNLLLKVLIQNLACLMKRLGFYLISR